MSPFDNEYINWMFDRCIYLATDHLVRTANERDPTYTPCGDRVFYHVDSLLLTDSQSLLSCGEYALEDRPTKSMMTSN